MRAFSAFFLLALLCLFPAAALGQATPFGVAAPAEIRPGQPVTFQITAPVDCTANVLLEGIDTGRIHRLLSDVALEAGENAVVWGGLLPSGQVPAAGEYLLSVEMLDTGLAHAVVTVGEAYPRLTLAAQSVDVLWGGPVECTLTASEAGAILMRVMAEADDAVLHEARHEAQTGANTLAWDGMLDGQPAAPGAYRLAFTLLGDGEEASVPAVAEVRVRPIDAGDLDFDQITSALFDLHGAQATAPYSALGDGSFWCVPPGETDDAILWDVLTQPITVYDDGHTGAVGHVYLRENPDGSGAAVAQIHALSQGLHVLGEVNEHGYVLVEAFSNYDPDYTPRTAEEKAHAFDIRQGYIRADCLKTLQVRQDIGFVIDKLTQRMYMFRDGRRVTEFVISTGLITHEKYYRETVAGEFITVGHHSGYWDGDLFTDLPIRFNGGTLLHEVCCTIGEDGVRRYGVYAARLGSKHSAGCVRVPYWPNEEGYNMRWLYENLIDGGRYKIIIWDDRNRHDTPQVWR